MGRDDGAGALTHIFRAAAFFRTAMEDMHMGGAEKPITAELFSVIALSPTKFYFFVHSTISPELDCTGDIFTIHKMESIRTIRPPDREYSVRLTRTLSMKDSLKTSIPVYNYFNMALSLSWWLSKMILCCKVVFN